MRNRNLLIFILCISWLIVLCGTEQTGTEQTAVEGAGQARPQAPAQPGVISNIEWSEDGKFLTYVNQGKIYQCDLATLEITQTGEVEEPAAGQAGRGGRQAGQRQQAQGRGRGQRTQQEGRQIQRPSRGHQYLTEQSPDGQWYAVCRDYNVLNAWKQKNPLKSWIWTCGL